MGGGKSAKPKPLNVPHLGAGGLQDAVRVFGAHALHDPGPQPLFDEADVRQQLGELPLQTGDFLRRGKKTPPPLGCARTNSAKFNRQTCRPRHDRKFSLQKRKPAWWPFLAAPHQPCNRHRTRHFHTFQRTFLACSCAIGTLYACSKARWSLLAKAKASFFSLASSRLSHGDTWKQTGDDRVVRVDEKAVA